MKAEKGTLKLWYNLLQIAIQQGLPINWKYYRAWGSKNQLVRWTFHRWWNERGHELFETTRQVVRLVEQRDSAVLVEVPTGLPLSVVRRSVSHIVLAARPTRRLGRSGRYAIQGRVNYKTLAQYKRLLEIDFDPKYSRESLEKKAQILRELYSKFRERGVKQRNTLRQQKRHHIARLFRNRDPEELGRGRSGIDAQKVERWGLSARHLLLNVADGRFPGTGYYGARLGARLAARLRSIGVTEIGHIKRAKPGRKPKKKLRQSALPLSFATAAADVSRALGNKS